MLKNEQKSAKTLPQKLAGLNKGRSAWGETMGGDTANSARGQWGSACALCLEQKFGVRCRVAECGEFGNAQHSKFSLAGACGQSENGAVFGRGTSLSLSLSRRSHVWHAFGLN